MDYSYIRSENAVHFLTAWNCEINMPDKEGNYTPLHLAVISSNAKIVRRLLLKGADKTLCDKNNKIPIEIAKENDLHNIFNMLEDKNDFCELYEIKNNHKLKNKNLFGVWMFFILIIFLHLITIFIIFPCILLFF